MKQACPSSVQPQVSCDLYDFSRQCYCHLKNIPECRLCLEGLSCLPMNWVHVSPQHRVPHEEALIGGCFCGMLSYVCERPQLVWVPFYLDTLITAKPSLQQPCTANIAWWCIKCVGIRLVKLGGGLREMRLVELHPMCYTSLQYTSLQ